MPSKKKELEMQKRAEAEEAARADAEFDAKYKAKTERKKVEKTVAESDKIVADLTAKAAAAKLKGYTDVYRSYISMIKLARARKRQAEMFLFQIDAMQTMRSLSKNSSELLRSMGEVMNSLGALTIDKTAMRESQRDFAKVQSDIDRQTASIETFLGGMELELPDGDGAEAFSDDEIEREIDAYIASSPVKADSEESAPAHVGDTAELEYMKRLLKS